MKVEIRIFKNAAIMMLQPLFMNLISLFVIGYVARKLGVEDFGIFNLAIIFSTLFYPIGLMGLNTVGIRDISKLRDNREESENYVGKMLPLRLVIFLSTVILIIIASMVTHYPARVTNAICIAAVIAGIQLCSEVVCDVFTAFERMEYTALILLISGLTLMTLSVFVLYEGYGLFQVLGVYAVGQMTGLVAAIFILRRRFLRIRPRIDLSFWKEKIIEGLPFITMSLIWAGMMRFDTIILSKVASPIELGFYTTGMILVTKVDLIPGVVANSIYPAISNYFSTGQYEEIKKVTREAFSIIVAISLPICIGTAFCGEAIIKLVFGMNYEGAGWILSMGIWASLFRGIQTIEFGILAALHKQRNSLHAYLVAGIVCLVLNLIFTYSFKTTGALIAFIGSQAILMGLFTSSILKELPGCLQFVKRDKILYLNMGLVILLLLVKSMNFISILILSGIFYLVGVFVLQIVTVGQIKRLKQI